MRTVAHAFLPLLLTSAVVAGVAAGLSTAPAGAQPRPSQARPSQPWPATGRLSCGDAQAQVKREGDTVLAIGSGGVSERLVADRSYCELSEIAELRFVPTRDNPQCPVGYRCKAPEFEDWNWK